MNILPMCALALCLLFSCGTKEARVIPRSKMAKIYAEMLITDQWIMSEPSVMRIADTSLVYEPILEKYGYDSEDYMKSVEHYLDDPERFSRIFRSASEQLDRRLKELKALQKAMEDEPEVPESDIDAGYLVPDAGKIPLKFTPDSISFVLDTTYMYFVPVYVERGDTIYRGPEVIVRQDTVAVADSISAEKASLVLPQPADSLGGRERKPLPGGPVPFEGRPVPVERMRGIRAVSKMDMELGEMRELSDTIK